MALSKETVAQLYVALFQRAAAKDELDGWYKWAEDKNADMNELAGAMLYEAVQLAKSDEDTAKFYPEYANLGDTTVTADQAKAIIENVYSLLLGKDYTTDPEGIDGWVKDVVDNGGTYTALGHTLAGIVYVANQYANGELEAPDDATKKAVEAFKNKTQVAVETAETIPTKDPTGDGKTDFDVFQNIVKVVTDDLATVEVAKVKIADIASNIIDGKTFVLTNSNNQTTGGVDNIIGTDKNDKIIGSVNSTNPTFDVGDRVDGGAGFDTLYVNLNANSAPVDVSNVELFQLRSTTTGATFDASSVTLSPDGTTFENYMSTNSLTISNITSTDAKFKVYNTTNNTTVTFTNSAVAGNDDTLTVTLDQAGTKNTSARGNFITSGIENMKIISTGDAKNYLATVGSDDDGTVDGTIGGSNLKKVTIIGDQYVEITNAFASTVKTLDASANTGGVNVNLSSSTSVNLDVKGGSGDDVVTVSTTGLNANDNIDLGDGTDTLVLKANNETFNTALDGVSNVETLAVKNTSASGAVILDASIVSGIQKVAFQGLNNGGGTDYAFTVTNAPNEFVATASTSKNISITTKETDSDAKVILDNSDASNTNSGIDIFDSTGGTATLDVSNAKTLTIESIGGHLQADSNDLIDGKEENSIENLTTSAKTLNITGDTDLELTTTDTDIKTVDASKFTGNVRVDIQTSTDKTITTGAGKDVVTLGAAKDTVNLGAGDDYLKIASGSLTSDDKLDGGEGTDALVFTDINTTINLNNNPETKLSNVSNFEKVLLSLSSTASQNTTLTLGDDAVSKFGGTFTVGAFDKTAGPTSGTTSNSYIIDASGVNSSTAKVVADFSNVTNTLANLTYKAGLNIDEVTGTKNNDTVSVTDTTLSSSDKIDAGSDSGNGDTLVLSITTAGGTSSNPKQITADQLSNVKGFETIHIGDANSSDSSSNNTKVTITDDFANANHNSSNQLTIDFKDIDSSAATADDNITLDASAVKQIKLSVTDGNGKDTIKLGAANDTIALTDDDVQDTITLGAGKDIVDAHNLAVNETGLEAKITDFDFGDNTSAGKVDELKLSSVSNAFSSSTQIKLQSNGTFDLGSDFIIVLDNTAYSDSAAAEDAVQNLDSDTSNDDSGKAYVFWQDTLGKVHLSYDADTDTDASGFEADLLVFTNVSISDVAQNLDINDLTFA